MQSGSSARLQFPVGGSSASSGSHPVARKALPRASDFSFSNVGLSVAAAEAIWLALKRAVEEILQGNNAQLRFEELYRNAYTLVLHKHGDMLYRGVEECITKRMARVAAEVARASDAVRTNNKHTQWTCAIRTAGRGPRRLTCVSGFVCVCVLCVWSSLSWMRW